MFKKFYIVFMAFFSCILLSSIGYPGGDYVETTVWLPDDFGGVIYPKASVYNHIDHKIYVCGGERITVIDAATDQGIAGIDVGKGATALLFNPTDNKIYCANSSDGSLTIIDGATDSVLDLLSVGESPHALVYNPANNKLYCANEKSGTVTVIDGAENSVIATIEVGEGPEVLVYNPNQNKVYCANKVSGDLTIIDGADDSVIGTLPACLSSALQDRYSAEGLSCRYRRFDSVAQLKNAGITLALVREAFLMDHCLAVLKVSDDAVTVADPVTGTRLMPYEQFGKIWRFCGIVLQRNPLQSI